MIRLKCPSCGNVYDAKDSVTGRMTKCPACKSRFEAHQYDGGGSHGLEQSRVADEYARNLRRDAIGGFVLFLVVIALAGWGISSCVGKYRANRRAEYESARLHGTIGMAKQLCEKKLKSELRSPSTAKIIYEKEEERDGNMFAFAGYIDGQNAMGATIRNRFGVVISYNSDKGEYHVEAFDITP